MALPPNSPSDIVITGLGIVSPIGIGAEAVKASLDAGKTGIRKTTLTHNIAAPDDVGGEVTDFNEETVKKVHLKDFRRSLKFMCRDIQMGVASAMQALQDSQLNMESLDKSRLGIEFGANLMLSPPEVLSPSANAAADEHQFKLENWGDRGFGMMEPIWLLKYLPNMPACHICIAADARGPNNSLTLDDASANVVIGEASRILERGAADVMITGATGTLLHPIRTIHVALMDHYLATSPKEPERRSRPFDKDRSGQVVGEASGTLILETRAHAEARGAKIYGRILGTGAATVSTPNGTAKIREAIAGAMKNALKQAKVEPADIGHVNAHGMGTIESDRAEAAAIRDVFGDQNVLVTAPKSWIGNAAAGAGIVELAMSLLALQDNNKVPAILNYETSDPESPINAATPANNTAPNKVFIATNITRIGQAASVIVEAA